MRQALSRSTKSVVGYFFKKAQILSNMKWTFCLIFGLMLWTVPGVAQEKFTGKASYYGGKFHGRVTASGEIYNQNDLTAAHKTLPFGTVVKVTNEYNGKSVELRINDRGPFVKGRIIDVSTKAAEILGMIAAGVVDVTVEVLEGKAWERNKPKSGGSSSGAKTYFKGDGLYEIAVQNVRLEGFGVQVNAYTEFYNLIDALAKLRKEGYKTVHVDIAEVNDKMFYRVIIGQFEERNKANGYKNALSEKGYNGIVVDLSKL